MKEEVKKKEVSHVIFHATLIGTILFGVAILGVAIFFLRFFISGWIGNFSVYLLIAILITGTVFLAIGIKRDKKKAVIILIVSIVAFIIVAVLVWLLLSNGLDYRQLNRPEPVFQLNQQEFSDEELLDATYSHYTVPEDFYIESFESPEYKISLVYLQTTFLRTQAEWKPGITDIELCTDNKIQASNWSELYYKNWLDDDQTLLSERETERFFEFKYKLDSRGTINGALLRIRKCSYLNRSMYNLYDISEDNQSMFLGIFNQRPVTEENVKKLIEYEFSYPSKILSSFSEDGGNVIRHTIYKIEVGSEDSVGAWVCEKIHLLKSEYTVDKVSGEIKEIRLGSVSFNDTATGLRRYYSQFEEDVRMIEGECYYAPVRML